MSFGSTIHISERLQPKIRILRKFLQHFWLLLTLAILYIIAWKIQSLLLLKGDVSWQMKMARILLAQGNYLRDFFEINPPLSIYLYMPTIALQNMFSLSAILSLRIYMLFLTSLSLLMCYPLLQRLFRTQDQIVASMFILLIAFNALVLPFTEFGQRENLLVIFTLPYFLFMCCRLDVSSSACARQHKVNNWYAMVIGILAGIGFAIKPFFLISFILVEIYYAFRMHSHQLNRNLFFFWVRVETICIILFHIVYLLLIYIFHYDYLATVIPIARQFYYPLFGYPWQLVIIEPIVLFCGAIIIFPFFHQKYRFQTLSYILSLAGFGMLVAYALQKLPWYYHLLPALSIALLAYFLLFIEIIKQIHFHKMGECLFALIIAVVFFYVPTKFCTQFYALGQSQKTDLEPLIHFLNKTAFHQPVYYFTVRGAYLVSVLEHAECYQASRIQFLAWMQRYYRTDLPQTKDIQYEKIADYFENMLAEDLNRNKPHLILIDNTPYQDRLGTYMTLDYLKILNHNKQFQLAFRPYQLLTQLKPGDTFIFDIYIRGNLS